MLESRRALLTVVVMALLVIAFAACDRTITRVEEVQKPANCFDCHSDQNTFLVAAEMQWENSVHASGHNIDRASSASCSPCHSSDGFVATVTGGTAQGYDNPTVIHCFTCHAPHTNANFHLRVTTPQTTKDGTSYNLGAGNLCVACHHARQNVNTYVTGTVGLSSHWGPHHSVQGDMIYATNGYEYTGYSYEEIVAHRDGTDDGCVDCHFKTTAKDVVGGHSFNMEYDLEGQIVRNTAACEDCHGTLSDFNYHTIQDSVDTLVDSLATILTNAGILDAEGEPLSVDVGADTAGAVWNYLMAHEDRSHGVHNSKYILGLLESAILYMQGSLPQPSPAAVARQEELRDLVRND